MPLGKPREATAGVSVNPELVGEVLAAHLYDVTEGDDYGYGPTVVFRFAVQIEDRIERGWVFASDLWTPKAKARRIAEALAGKTFDEGDPIDIDAAIGLPCSVVYEKTDKGEIRIGAVLKRKDDPLTDAQIAELVELDAEQAAAADDDEGRPF